MEYKSAWHHKPDAKPTQSPVQKRVRKTGNIFQRMQVNGNTQPIKDAPVAEEEQGISVAEDFNINA